ncbi:acetyl-CoA carboxylase biotin carboxylase subunit [Rhodococcus sp. Leaf7]|uniref:acetyl-CoA carboxylase biotin carboxylase subunit n=1 Tax=unclassified Rhodococcus (in: high G+C Gram-positive bacteria) TaxID=192944 RepID=UPI0006F548E6|nr:MULTISPECIES: acetyl-CoA carboxylase biotin carboxylase subunit [unclassified Rhodococcus (in: high G+C Gram-positive bacteria)]KQU01927.1 acetyl-CoA carboxylase biotin carboxylase subunit [Rhodococcus sp. Leaf7]KQU38220.1 acetyl-CoA carboxylase biotin carboxylase subunit [Rhodococcus sp. Leaf247]
MKRLLVANRGEIAVRIIRTAHEMGLETVLAASEADTESLAAALSDHVVVIGPAQAGHSYLDSAAVIDAVHSSGADAVHPGYGFLSEDANFARSVEAAGVTWVGPSPDSIALMGNKAAAREAARDAGVPVLAGSDGAILADQDVRAIAESIGFPLLIKASAGGGGRGIRIVETVDALEGEIQLAVAEAGAAFGDSAIYLERFIDRARHVEVQILGDGTDVVHLFDRDCSLQRRQQKIVEETPAPNLPAHLREQMLTAAVDLGKRCAYRGAGTVEFLYDQARGEICFIEMNTRLQVEHPVTEMITGMDLVREQLRIASGEKLGYDQQQITRNGHAIEMRINAENPAMGFMPSPGTITDIRYPGGPGVRVDSGVVAGSVVSPYYDSLVAKIVVWHSDRPSALGRALRALSELRVDGVNTTTSYLTSVLAHRSVVNATHHTKFLEQSADQLLQGTTT